jgi:drug/metabolite transporter (DMT)-like permease
LFWAGNAVVGRASVGHIAPLALSFWRWALAFLILLPFTARDIWAARSVIQARWRDLLLISVLGIGVYNSMQYLALQTSPVLNVTLIAAAGPVTSLAIGTVFFKAGVSRQQIIGALLSLLGVIWVVARGNFVRLMEFQFEPGDGFMLLAIGAWSTYTWLLRTRRPPMAAFTLLTVQIGIGALAILPFTLAETMWSTTAFHLDRHVAATLAYVAIFPSLIAYYCWDRGVARAGATVPVYFANLTPLFAAAIATLWLGEEIALFHLLGGALIFLGIIVGNRR